MDANYAGAAAGNRRMFLYVNEKVRDAQREVNDFLTGRGQIGVKVVLGLLAVSLVYFVITGWMA